jgi:hypothetical protein
MTILLMEGFDLYNGTDAPIGIAANWLLDNYYATLSTPAGRFGGKCFCTVWGGSVQYSLAYRTLAAPTSAFSFGLASDVRFLGSPFVWLLSASSLPVLPAHRQLRQPDRLPRIEPDQPDRSWQNQRPGAAPQWHYIEVEGVIGDTGAVRVYVDGAKVLDLPGSIPSSSQPDRDHPVGLRDRSATYLFDDLYVIDTDHRLGERKITVLTPPPMWPRPSPRRPAPTTTPASTMPCPTPPTM